MSARNLGTLIVRVADLGCVRSIVANSGRQMAVAWDRRCFSGCKPFTGRVSGFVMNSGNVWQIWAKLGSS